MTAQPPEGQPGTILGPQPCPQGFGVQVAQTSSGPMVVATFIGPCGQWVVFLDVGSTAKLIDQLTDAVAQARSADRHRTWCAAVSERARPDDRAPAMTAAAKPEAAMTAKEASVAGLLHGTLCAGGWTVLEADPAAGRCTIGLAGLFEPGIVADISVKLRQMEPAP